MAEQKQVIPEGFKQTEVGIIPADWEIKALKEFTELTSSKRIFEGDYVSSGIPFYRGQEISSLIERKDISELCFISKEKYLELSKKFGAPKQGDILITAVGTLGNAFLIDSDEPFYFKDGNLIWLRKIVGIESRYLIKQLHNQKKRILDGAVGSSQKALTMVVLKELLIPTPKVIEEQTAIANALSDVDALISELEKFIAKKQAIKTATMQQLLTGKTRLPEFALREDGTPKGYKASELGEIPEDWEVCLLGEAVDFLDGLRKPVKSGDRAKISGIFPYYGASGIVDYVNDFIFDEDLILLGEDGENILSRNLPLAFRVSGKIWVNNHAHVLKPRDYFDIVYLTEFLESLDYSLLNSGTAQPKLNKQACINIKVLQPIKSEQHAIALFISDLIEEIEQLQTRLNKIRQIKQGMMQELLTGKTRLVKPEVTA